MSEHTRRPDYWTYYHLGHSSETSFMIETVANLVREHPCPRQEKGNRGRPPVHSKDKLDFICILMVAWHKTSRDMESDLSVINIPWWNGEPVPDHTTISRHLQAIPYGWLTAMLARTARLCMAEAGGATGPLGADSSGVETTRYETVVRPLKREKDFVEMAQKEYLKYHIVAVLGLQIILESEITPGNVNDVTMLPPMLGEMGRQGLSPGLPVFHADRGYDSNYNCQILFEMGITPNIKQRSGSVNRGKPYRSRAAKIFDEEEYHQRGMIEGVFGGEESKRHQLHCRFILPDNRRRFGKIRAIAWNIKVLNRFRCARIRGIEIPTYGTAPCA